MKRSRRRSWRGSWQRQRRQRTASVPLRAAHVGLWPRRAPYKRAPGRVQRIGIEGSVGGNFLVIGVGGGDHEFLGGCVENGLLLVVGAIGKTGHLHLESHGVFFVAHVGADVQASDFLCGGVKRESHLIAGEGIIGEDQVHRTGNRVQGNLASLISGLHFLRVGWHVQAEDGLHVLHVVFHFGFFLGDDFLFHPAAAGRFRWRADSGFLNLAVRTVLARILRGRLGVALQGELGSFDPLILEELLLIFGGSLLDRRKLLLKFRVLGKRWDSG